jgi:hypothetical protein
MTKTNPLKGLQQLLKEKWTEYLVEIIVIILGITISFALDEWKEQRQKKELEQVYLKSLHNDLIQDIRNLKRTIEETQLVIRQAKMLLAQAELSPRADSLPIPPVQFFTALRDILRRPLFIAHDATFSDLKSSGNMQIITDFPLKNALFGYFLDYESIKLIEVAEREVTITITGPYLMKHFPLRYLERRYLADTSSQHLKENNFMPMLRDREFSNNLFIRLSNRAELLQDYQEALALSQKIKSRVEKQLR